MGPPKVYRVLVASIGGQGGATISEVLHYAVAIERERYAREHGFYEKIRGRCDLEVRYMLPGLAQRSGSVFSTLTFVDPHSDHVPEKTMYFSDKVYAGSLDLLVATELTEAVRYAGRGLLSESSTVVVNEARSYTVAEKLPTTKRVASVSSQISLLRSLAGRYIGVKATEIAVKNGLPPVTANTVLLGALCSGKVLPVSRESFVDALKLRFSGRVLEDNLKAFELGEKARATAVPENPLAETRSLIDGKARRLYRVYGPEKAEAYARLLKLAAAAGSGAELLREIAVRIADNVLSWESPYRVAKKYLDLADQYRRRGYYKIKAHVVVLPGWFTNALPGKLYSIADRILRSRRFVYPVVVNLGSPPGYFVFWLLSKLSFLERRSPGYKKRLLEAARITRRVLELSNKNYGLAVEAARSLRLVRGYGAVRRRSMAAYMWLLGAAETLAEKLEGREALAAYLVLEQEMSLDGRGLEKARGKLAGLLAQPPSEPPGAPAGYVDK